MTGYCRLPVIIYLLFFILPCSGQEPDFIAADADTGFFAGTGRGYLSRPDTSRVTDAGAGMIPPPDTAMPEVSGTAEHSPRKAAVYSAVFPGLGQIYNRKYWKVPIVYLGFGTLTGSVIYNARNYRHYRDKYVYMLENNLEEYENQSIPEVQWYKNTHRRYRDLFIIVTAGFYGFQIIDAVVDAHLLNFDVSDDLSLGIDPVMFPGPGTEIFLPGYNPAGLRCCLYF